MIYSINNYSSDLTDIRLNGYGCISTENLSAERILLKLETSGSMSNNKDNSHWGLIKSQPYFILKKNHRQAFTTVAKDHIIGFHIPHRAISPYHQSRVQSERGIWSKYVLLQLVNGRALHYCIQKQSIIAAVGTKLVYASWDSQKKKKKNTKHEAYDLLW
jgi:hypothetical protein